MDFVWIFLGVLFVIGYVALFVNYFRAFVGYCMDPQRKPIHFVEYQHDEVDTNPATGLPMGGGGYDVGGSPFGIDINSR